MSHPFQLMSRSTRRLVLWISSIGTAVMFLTIWLVGRPLITPAAPLGIVSFELAGEPFIVRSILGGWGQSGQIRAGFSLGLDSLFLICYSTLLVAGCTWTAEWIRIGNRFPRSATKILAGAVEVLMWGQWIAAIFGLTEDYILLSILLGGGMQWARWARLCAEAKYALAGTALLIVVLSAYMEQLKVLLLLEKRLGSRTRPAKA